MFFNGKHLRVTKKRTINGTTPELDENGVAKVKIDFLPMSAKRGLEERNKDLPDFLKMKIEVVGGDENLTTKNKK